MIDITITGDKDLEQLLRHGAVNAPRAGAAELFAIGEDVVGDAKEHFVPVDLGNLKNTGFVELPKVEGGENPCVSGLVGPRRGTALAVHEHLSEHSPRSWKIAEAHGRPVTLSPGGPAPNFWNARSWRPFPHSRDASATRSGRRCSHERTGDVDDRDGPENEGRALPG